VVSMDLYRIKALLWRLSAALGMATAAAAAAMALWPMDTSGAGRASGAATTTAPADAVGEGDRPLDHYAVVWERPLRGPLYDPKPVVVVKAPPPEPKFQYKLTGTVLEEGFSFATFADPRGKMTLCRVGQQIGEAELKSISADSVQVLLAGKLLTVPLEKPKPRH